MYTITHQFNLQAQRELDDYVESNESMNREINNLKNKLRFVF